jgi:hypothetical protein
MTSEDSPEQRNDRNALETFGKMLAGAGIDHLFNGTFAPIFVALAGVVAAVLVLLKTGILQIANWPTSAFIVLGIVGFIVISAFVALTIVWGLIKLLRFPLWLLVGGSRYHHQNVLASSGSWTLLFLRYCYRSQRSSIG